MCFYSRCLGKHNNFTWLSSNIMSCVNQITKAQHFQNYDYIQPQIVQKPHNKKPPRNGYNFNTFLDQQYQPQALFSLTTATFKHSPQTEQWSRDRPTIAPLLEEAAMWLMSDMSRESRACSATDRKMCGLASEWFSLFPAGSLLSV